MILVVELFFFGSLENSPVRQSVEIGIRNERQFVFLSCTRLNLLDYFPSPSLFKLHRCHAKGRAKVSGSLAQSRSKLRFLRILLCVLLQKRKTLDLVRLRPWKYPDYLIGYSVMMLNMDIC